VTLLTAPGWILVLIAAEALALALLAWRFGWRGVLWGAAAGLAFWFALGFSASFLVSRLEGGGATPPSHILAGAVTGTLRAAAAALPALAAAALLGLMVRRLVRPA
jgi:hypothetical protein